MVRTVGPVSKWKPFRSSLPARPPSASRSMTSTSQPEADEMAGLARPQKPAPTTTARRVIDPRDPRRASACSRRGPSGMRGGERLLRLGDEPFDLGLDRCPRPTPLEQVAQAGDLVVAEVGDPTRSIIRRPAPLRSRWPGPGAAWVCPRAGRHLTACLCRRGRRRRPGGRHAAGRPRPAARRARGTGRRGRSPASAAPRWSGRSTVYRPDVAGHPASQVGRAELGRHHVYPLARHQLDPHLVPQAPDAGRSGVDQSVGEDECEVAGQDRQALAVAALAGATRRRVAGCEARMQGGLCAGGCRPSRRHG